MTAQLRSTGTFETPNAAKYLAQLCKHFAHKVEASHTDQTGHVALPMGLCRLWAEAGQLRIEVTGEDDAALSKARQVIDSHLERFAFREDFTQMNWAALV